MPSDASSKRKERLRKLRMPGVVDSVSENEELSTIGKAEEVIKRLKKKRKDEDEEFGKGQKSEVVTGSN